ncbi:phosphoglycolate phosphatase [Rhodoferax sp.]|uniref:phosphoglycolate phosphatase n=1 Tax=Rhodoferax sp. TaxID=50421 RepID=UPI002775EBC1|nr:phosphoglycolate phosphatase [Rhodoferax sp.]
MDELDLNRFDAVLLDLDGTLVDTLGDFVAVLNLMLADLPPPFEQSRVHANTVELMVGKGSEYLIKSVLAKVLSDSNAAVSLADKSKSVEEDALYPMAWQRYQHHYQAINGQFARVYPGVLQGLQQLRSAGKKLACLTNKPTAFAQTLLRGKGLVGFFDVVYGGDAFERGKPDPMPLLKACEALGTQPRRTLMVGDSSNDAQAARAAGCPVWLVRYGYNHGQPIDTVPAEAYLDSLEQLAISR